MAATNPFRFGSLALDEAFTDRSRELKELRSDILNGQDVVVIGPRRYGKSSLVLRAVAEVRARRALVAYVDVSTAPTKERLAEKLARTIHEDVASRVERARDKALSLFRSLRVQPTISVDVDGRLTFAFAPGARAADVDATLEQLLELLGRVAHERKRRVALVLDEFQEVTELDPHLPRILRAAFQTQPDVAHVYLGSKRHLMRRIFSDEHEPFWRSAKVLELGVIPPDEFAAYVGERFTATGKSIADDAVRTLLEYTGGHPYATQQLAYFVWEETAPRATARPEAVARAVERLVDSEHNHFQLVWDDATRNERLLLLAFAAQPGRPFTGEYRRAHGLPAASQIQRSLAGLMRKELVGKREDGSYAIVEPFLIDWLLRNSER